MHREEEELVYHVEWSEGDREHVGLCSEFPSLSWLEETPEKALEGIRRLVGEVLEDLTPLERNRSTR